jgi:hypothetical protein
MKRVNAAGESARFMPDALDGDFGTKLENDFAQNLQDQFDENFYEERGISRAFAAGLASPEPDPLPRLTGPTEPQ